MKKYGILNSNISKVLSDLGHKDLLTISDCGLPISKDTPKIDISLKLGMPSFIETLEEVLKDMEIEQVIIAEEIKKENKNILNQINNILDDDIKINFISHNDFKDLTKKSKAVIRTGENTPYANIILVSACIF